MSERSPPSKFRIFDIEDAYALISSGTQYLTLAPEAVTIRYIMLRARLDSVCLGNPPRAAHV
jgi:hypothetical protein